MDGYERRAPILMQAGHSAEDRLAEFLRTGRIIGGLECCAFLCALFDDRRPPPPDYGG